MNIQVTTSYYGSNVKPKKYLFVDGDNQLSVSSVAATAFTFSLDEWNAENKKVFSHNGRFLTNGAFIGGNINSAAGPSTGKDEVKYLYTKPEGEKISKKGYTSYTWLAIDSMVNGTKIYTSPDNPKPVFFTYVSPDTVTIPPVPVIVSYVSSFFSKGNGYFKEYVSDDISNDTFLTINFKFRFSILPEPGNTYSIFYYNNGHKIFYNSTKKRITVLTPSIGARHFHYLPIDLEANIEYNLTVTFDTYAKKITIKMLGHDIPNEEAGNANPYKPFTNNYLLGYDNCCGSGHKLRTFKNGEIYDFKVYSGNYEHVASVPLPPQPRITGYTLKGNKKCHFNEFRLIGKLKTNGKEIIRLGTSGFGLADKGDDFILNNTTHTLTLKNYPSTYLSVSESVIIKGTIDSLDNTWTYDQTEKIIRMHTDPGRVFEIVDNVLIVNTFDKMNQNQRFGFTIMNETDCSDFCNNDTECRYFSFSRSSNNCKLYDADSCLTGDLVQDNRFYMYKILNSHRKGINLEKINNVRLAMEQEMVTIQGELSQSLSSLEDSKNALDQVEQALTGGVTTLTDSTEDLALKRDTLLNAINTQKSNMENLSGRFEDAKSEITATSDVLDSALDKLVESNASLGQTKDQLAQNKESLDNTKGDFDGTKTKLAELQAKLDAANAITQNVTSSLADTDVSFFGDAMEIINNFFSFLF
jgi:hypothetical protein